MKKFDGFKPIDADPAKCVFKTDARSTVWQTADGNWVIKRFGHNRIRQILSWLIGLHPGQRECRRARALAAQELPVVQVAKTRLISGRLWVATEFVGPSMQQLVASGALRDERQRLPLLSQLADLASRLVRANCFFRDFQLANIVVDANGHAKLIDVGSARGLSSESQISRMLNLLIETMLKEGATIEDCLTVLGMILERSPACESAARRIIGTLQGEVEQDTATPAML